MFFSIEAIRTSQFNISKISEFDTDMIFNIGIFMQKNSSSIKL